MMTLSRLIIIVLFVSLNQFTFGQKSINCKLDTFNIITNQNLNNFLYKLKFESLREYKTLNAIPSFIKETLDCLTGGDFSLCNPDQNFKNSCVSPKNLPQRQLQYLCIGENIFGMIYLKGTIVVETRIILIMFNDETIQDIWVGYDLSGKARNRNQLINVLKKKRNKIVDFGFL